MIGEDVKENSRKWNWNYIGDRANARENYIRIYKKLKSQGEEKVEVECTLLTLLVDSTGEDYLAKYT